MKDRRQPETLRLRQISPAITASDLEASYRWYTEVMGFYPGETYEEDGEVLGVSVRAGSIDIFLGQDDFKKGRERTKGLGFRFHCTTAQDVDVLAAAIQERGGELLEDPEDKPWGTREFAVRDPDGFVFTISQPRDQDS